VQLARRAIRSREGLRHVTQLGEAALEHADVAGQLGELRLLRAAGRRLTLQPFERRELPAGSYWSPWFSRDGARLLVVRGATDVVELPVAGGEARVVWSDGVSAIWHVEEAPDGAGWLAAAAVFEGDLVLLEGRFR